MLIQLLLQILISLVTILFSWLPDVAILPFGIDAALSYVVELFHGAIETLPYLEIVWTCFLYLIGFEILLVILKFFLGSRHIAKDAN